MLDRFHDALTMLEITESTNSKVAFIRKLLDGQPELGKLFELALSPYITFGVAQIPDLRPLMDDNRQPLPWMQLLEQLASRTLTGDRAKEEIGYVRLHLDANEELPAFDRILLKDLRCGVAAETVNKARPGTVPVFSCQLALSEMPELATLKFPIYAEPKWDGVRTIAMKRNGVVKLFSRNGKEFENFVELANALTGLPEGTVLDGEVVSPRGFSALMTRAKAAPGKAVDVPLSYRVFDGMTAYEWDKQECGEPLSSRRQDVLNYVDALASPIVVMGEAKLCNSVAEVEAFYAEQLALGLEGIMLKSPDGLYTFKRNKTWLKLKPFDTADLKITGLIEGKGKYQGSLGALICEGEHQGKQIKTEVGSGFTDDQRNGIWSSYIRSVGRTAEIRYQEITKAQDSDTWSLRFPTFLRWRDDK
jgi:DNA ligase-1